MKRRDDDLVGFTGDRTWMRLSVLLQKIYSDLIQSLHVMTQTYSARMQGQVEYTSDKARVQFQYEQCWGKQRRVVVGLFTDTRDLTHKVIHVMRTITVLRYIYIYISFHMNGCIIIHVMFCCSKDCDQGFALQCDNVYMYCSYNGPRKQVL